MNFERKNLGNESSLPFESAHYCFEVSSEGELEQVRPLIEKVLSNHKKIEIIYSSPSVENKVNNFYKQYPEQVRVLRMPLLSGSIISFLYFQSVWSWVSAPVIVFCRYDFFPELLLFKLFRKRFILVSGAFKKTSWYKISSFKLFDVVIAATDTEKKNFENLLGDKATVYSCDFRIPRITERFIKSEETLATKTSLQNYLQKLKSIPAKEKIILGSAWKSDLAILNSAKLIDDVKAGRMHLLLAPHKLDEQSIASLKDECERLFGSSLVEVVSDSTPYQKSPVVILKMSGILCELYSFFSMTYVGGGYERSIHSVLEPFFSNNLVITGPLISRSTEYDLAHEIAPDEIHVLNNPESFYTIIESSDLLKLKLKDREEFRARSQVEMNLIISEILS
ncbi:MAG: hypothetical protein H7177_06100 [Rhizobacter sp.]|nr:hypothetical protein [Bacteriovorax sp.]